MTPSSEAIKSGKEFDLDIRVNVTNGSANAVDAQIVYTLGKLHCESITWGTTWDLTFESPASGCENDTGQFDLVAGIFGGTFTGDVLIATVHFRAGTVGTGQVSFGSSSGVVDPSTGTNILTQTTGGTYTINPK